MLLETTTANIMRSANQQVSTLTTYQHDIALFEELCAVLRAQGIAFTETIEAEENDIYYHINPTNHGDYLEIIEAMGGMGATRFKCGHMAEIIHTQNDAPTFWLHIPESH